jgi:RNA polymerase sigma-70 factor (ECF subfamily)
MRPNRNGDSPGSKGVIAVLGREADADAPPSIARADDSEFSELVEPYLPKMYHLAERLAGATTRDDVVQEALLNAWRKRSQFDPSRGSLGAWLMAITADQARKSWRRKLVFVGRVEQSKEELQEDHLDIERAVRSLPARQRLAVDCVYFAGLTVTEAAAVMRCSEGTVKSTLSDARRNLRPRLEVRP